ALPIYSRRRVPLFRFERRSDLELSPLRGRQCEMLFLFQASGPFSVHDLQLIAPELILTTIACVALVMEVILPYKLSKWTAYFSLAGIALALISVGALFRELGGTFSLNSLQAL